MDHKEDLCKDLIPMTAMVESVIREGLIARYGEAYIDLILDGWSITTYDALKLEIHTFSDFQAEIISMRLRTDIEQIVAAIYGSCPNILIVHNK